MHKGGGFKATWNKGYINAKYLYSQEEKKIYV